MCTERELPNCLLKGPKAWRRSRSAVGEFEGGAACPFQVSLPRTLLPYYGAAAALAGHSSQHMDRLPGVSQRHVAALRGGRAARKQQGTSVGG